MEIKPGDLVEDVFTNRWKVKTILADGRLACKSPDRKKDKIFSQDEVKPTERPKASIRSIYPAISISEQTFSKSAFSSRIHAMKFRVRFGLLVILTALMGTFVLGAAGALQPAKNVAGPKTTVYGTDTGKKYHRTDCQVFRKLENGGEPGAFEAKSKIKMTLADATVKYGPKGQCRLCFPPLLDKNAPPTEEKEEKKDEPKGATSTNRTH